MTQHHLRLLVDYCVEAKVAAAKLNTIGKANAITTLDVGLRDKTDDEDIIDIGRRQDRIVVTGDFRSMNEHFYPPCGHGGLLLIRQDPTADIVYRFVRAFMLSGHRAKASHCVTHLWEDRCRIHTHTGIEEHVYGQTKPRGKRKRVKKLHRADSEDSSDSQKGN